MCGTEALSVQEVREKFAYLNQIKTQIKEEIVSQVKSYENEIYRIKDGRIAYQPFLIERLRAIAIEMKNTKFLTKLKKIADVTYDLEINLDVKLRGEGIAYECVLSSDLPDVAPLSRQTIVFHFTQTGERDKVLSSITEEFTKALSNVNKIPLYNTGSTEFVKLSDEVVTKAQLLGVSIQINNTVLYISPNTDEIELESVVMFIEQSKISKCYMHRHCYNTDIRAIIENTLIEDISDYETHRLSTQEHTDKNQQLQELLESNRNFHNAVINTQVELTSEKDNQRLYISGNIVIEVSLDITIFIDFEEDTLTYYVEEMGDYFMNTLIEEKYIFKPLSIAQIYQEINTIYEKTKIAANMV